MISTPDSQTPSETESALLEEVKEESAFSKEFSEKLAAYATPEEKIAYGLEFMRGSISQEGSPRFRQFWEARKLVLPFFKENLGTVIRSKLWNEYVELTVEARKLKEILEEQSSFAMEQIDLAIQATEADMQSFVDTLAASPDVGIPENCHTIIQKASVYNKIQKELNLLNALAGRLSGLRKEVIKTDMRIRFKTKFFKRLSDLGDQVFPKRKELIEAVSVEFEKDVDAFVSKYFKGDEVSGAPYYALREEIKSLQGAAKIFTLNSGVFTRTRLKLSECWDKVKVLEKEHKKEVLEKRQASSEKIQEIQSQIDPIKEKVAEMSLEEVNKEIDRISLTIKEANLHRDDVRKLKDELYKLRAPHLAAQEEKLKALEAAEKERLLLKREAVSKLKEKISQGCKMSEEASLEDLKALFAEIEQELAAIDLSKMERQQIQRSFRPIKDQIIEKEERSLLNLSDDDKKALENLNSILVQKKQRRAEIKEQVEICRKALGGSGLDFEKAMQYQELLEQEKERLEKANAGIEEIEQKIAQLEG
jgi:hypothetical protein